MDEKSLRVLKFMCIFSLACGVGQLLLGLTEAHSHEPYKFKHSTSFLVQIGQLHQSLITQTHHCKLCIKQPIGLAWNIHSLLLELSYHTY